MRRVGLIAVCTLLALIAWAALVGFDTLSGRERATLAPQGLTPRWRHTKCVAW